jgi:beta-galactosidase GanA
MEPIEQHPNNFSILLSDADNRTVADSFSLSQIDIFEAVMIEAEKFAKTNEAAGAADAPKVTRFVDKKEPSLIVDVAKTGIESRFYVTLNCLTGHITVDAGAIKRDGKEHDALFYSMLSRIQALKTAAQPQ